jgi:L-iditol 2-dehydrogenase
VLCIGGGPLGLSIAQVAKAKGAGHVFVSDPSPLARRVVNQFEQFTCIDPTTQTLADVLRDTVGEPTVAAIFDSVGSAETMPQALPLLAESGTYVNLAVHDAALDLRASVLGSERTLTTSSNAYYDDEKEAHELISSGTVNVRSMITHRFRLEDFQQAFDLLLAEPRKAYKVVFEFLD